MAPVINRNTQSLERRDPAAKCGKTDMTWFTLSLYIKSLLFDQDKTFGTEKGARRKMAVG